MAHRVIVMGGEGVGKTSLIRRYLNYTFPSSHNHTLEDLHKKDIRLTDGSRVDVDVLDTSGSREDRALVKTNIQLGDAFMLVYAVDCRQSYHEALVLAVEVTLIRGKDVPMMLVGNKTDTATARTVCYHEALHSVCGRNNMNYMETSAKTNFRVEKAFEMLLPRQNSSAYIVGNTTDIATTRRVCYHEALHSV